MSFFPSLLYCIPKGIDIISGLPVKRLTRCEYAGKKRVQWLSSLHISQGEASTHSHSQTRPQRIRTSNQNDAPNESMPLYSKPSPSGFIPLVKSRPQRIHTYLNPFPSESLPFKSRLQRIHTFIQVQAPANQYLFKTRPQ